MFEHVAQGKQVQEESLKDFVNEYIGKVTHLYESITVSEKKKKQKKKVWHVST